MSMYGSSGDTGSGDTGVNLGPHATGIPGSSGALGAVTAGHTWLIIVGALALLWLFGGVILRKIRM